MWPYGLYVAVFIGIACAWNCFRRQRRYSAEGTTLWVLFVLFFGVASWIGWRLHCRWPTLAMTGIERSKFVCPETNGLEILEPIVQSA